MAVGHLSGGGIAIFVRWEDLSQKYDEIDVWIETCGSEPSPLVVHYHDYYEINFILQGTGNYYFGDKQYRINAGQVFVINDREPHYAFCDPGVELKMIICVFRPQIVNDAVFDNREFMMPFKERSMEYRNQIIATDPCAQEIGALLRLIHDEHTNLRIGHKLFMQAYVYEILACLYRYYRQADQIGKDMKLQRDIDNIRPALLYLKKNYAQDIAMTDMANLVCMSPNRFSAMFKKINQMNFRAYLTKLRICAAKELLRGSDLTITEIAMNTGFPTSAYFTRVFSKEAELSPSEYRTNCKIEEETPCDTSRTGKRQRKG